MTRFRLMCCSIVGFLALGALVASTVQGYDLEPVLEEQLALIAAQPENPQLHNDLGNLYLLLGDVDAAEVAYRRAVDLAPSYADAWFNLASLAQRLGRLEEAGDLYRDLLELDPDYAWAHYQLGVLLESDGRRDAAVERYARSFALDPMLSFPSENPHVIDNGLMAEALLRSDHFRAEQRRVETPARYADATRIANLMVEPVLAASVESEEEADPMIQEEAEARRPSATGRPAIATESGVAAERLQSAPEGSVIERRDAASTRGDVQSRPSTVTRGGASIGVVTTPRAAPREQRTGGPQATDAAPSTSTTDAGSAPEASSATDSTSETPDRRRYRPSRGSTASLELRLETDSTAG
ncbi:MAG: tetratricopeptide repeat protein [Acidobacteriota bacterium]